MTEGTLLVSPTSSSLSAELHLSADSALAAAAEAANVELRTIASDSDDSIATIRIDSAPDGVDVQWVAWISDPVDNSEVLVTPEALSEVLANLAVGNMSISDFSHHANSFGVFEQFPEIGIPDNARFSISDKTTDFLGLNEPQIVIPL